MQKWNSLFVLIMLFSTAQAQDQNYFQQEVNFKIQVELNDSRHSITAFEEIEYINNSPDSLDFLWFHIWPNAYSNNKTAFWKQKLTNFEVRKYFDHQLNPGYIDSHDFCVNGRKVAW